ncbi:MAG: Hsp33 family molecular chaperone HslO [Bacillales bacterium]|jgi:molecular chaperone Hsp33|nr:Hsp33 family molecular chaperone HslO [Bacillales bacterium]
MKDYLVKALAYNGQIRAYAVCSTETIQEAVKRQGTIRTSSAALGRVMTAGVMMGCMQKGEIKTNIKINGGGPIGAILVDANAKGEVRGYVTNPKADVEAFEQGKLDVRSVVGTDGTLTVIKDLGLRENFSGQVPLISGELAEDFTYYFAASEQTPSSVALGVLVNPDDTIKAAGGFIVQLLPGTSEEVITKLENSLATFPPISRLIEQGLSPEEIIEWLFGDGNYTILEKMPVQFKCQCSRERIAGAIVSLGKEEILGMIEEDGKAEAHCHFCNEFYEFDEEELSQLCKEAK